uniref:7TM_GPCR_Srx domain-containing protein n=1 Tax=Heligmosomoides polygyrus TaxID=6339 RepID=A0A8L8KAC1_HELPZ
LRVFQISFVGSLANWLVATTTLRLPSMRNSFGRLLSSQASGEAVLCSVFAFIYSPMVFFDIDAMKRNSWQFGIIQLMCYDICIFSHLFIALNRMCAICLPLHYELYFNPNKPYAYLLPNGGQNTSSRLLRVYKAPRLPSRREKHTQVSVLLQAVLQGIVFAVELYTYFHLAWQYEHRWAVFVLTTVAWNLVHCVDALIIIGFNAEFRRLLKSPKRMFSK